MEGGAEPVMIDIEELVLLILRTHVMTSVSYVNPQTGIRTHSRRCAGCAHDLPWRDWEAPLQEHVAKVVAERLGA